MPGVVVAWALCFAMLLAACAETRSERPDRRGSTPFTLTRSARSSTGTRADQRYTVYATVVQGAGNAILCLGAIATPSICWNSPTSNGKVPVTNWDWERVQGEEVDADVIWGEYQLLGTYDGESFTVIEVGSRAPSIEGSDDPITIPCAEPEGGWVATDSSRTTDADLEAAGRYVDGHPDSAGYWIKYLQDDIEEAAEFNLTPYVLVAAFRRDIDRHQAALAEIWGGPLCMVAHSRTQAELSQIQEEVHSDDSEELGIQVFGSSTDVFNNRVEIEVVVFDEEAQAIFERRYGAGAVHQVPSLIPVD